MTEKPARIPRQLRRVSYLGIARELLLARGNVFRFALGLHRRYGEYVWLPFGLHAYLMSDPADLRHVLVTNSANYIKGGALVMAQLLLGEGLLTSEGSIHHRHRRTMQPMFHRQKIQSFAETILGCTNHRAESWRDGEVRDISSEVTHMTSSVISTALFSIDLEDEAYGLSDAIVVA